MKYFNVKHALEEVLKAIKWEVIMGERLSNVVLMAGLGGERNLLVVSFD